MPAKVYTIIAVLSVWKSIAIVPASVTVVCVGSKGTVAYESPVVT